MPKQVGLHQIKGKYGTTSYYGRKYSDTGYLRSINQELSERVKTGENYVGTREQNIKFRRCGRAMWCVLNGFAHRYNYITRLDSNAVLMKFFRENYIDLVTSEDENVDRTVWRKGLASVIVSLQKNKYDYFRDIPISASYTSVYDQSSFKRTIGFELSLEVESSVFSRFPFVVDGGSLFEVSIFSLDYYGSRVAQIQYFGSSVLGDIDGASMEINESVTYGAKEPNNSLVYDEDGMFAVVGFIPSINGVLYRSLAAYTVVVVPERV